MALTSTEQVAHPDPEHGMLPPQPILLVVTSDGALRLFTFAKQQRSADSVTRPALSYDDAPCPAAPAAAAQVCVISLLSDVSALPWPCATVWTPEYAVCSHHCTACW